MYEVTTNLARSLVKAKLSGFFSVEEVQAFSRDEQAAARQVVNHSGYFNLLVEGSGGVTQAQDVIGAFNELASASTLKAQRIAIVVESALLRLQLRRVLARDQIRLFETIAEAEDWLAELTVQC